MTGTRPWPNPDHQQRCIITSIWYSYAGALPIVRGTDCPRPASAGRARLTSSSAPGRPPRCLRSGETRPIPGTARPGRLDHATGRQCPGLPPCPSARVPADSIPARCRSLRHRGRHPSREHRRSAPSPPATLHGFLIAITGLIPIASTVAPEDLMSRARPWPTRLTSGPAPARPAAGRARDARPDRKPSRRAGLGHRSAPLSRRGPRLDRPRPGCDSPATDEDAPHRRTRSRPKGLTPGPVRAHNP